MHRHYVTLLRCVVIPWIEIHGYKIVRADGSFESA